ncbi:MAG: bifunctional (p)ppGpp synthetase/guanosine-3',5'-bis(diphosphate) 3'-pyrophosphohydrolase [Bacteroidetes bacterium]|nr:bifunctional (p)ppGpp synthetase/guanosine-3',5'-bis(diphosphate) 3'-pyrophosphohydrolase [Bacteroidota bacterium]
MKLLIDAILFASECHSGQVRKDGHTPYINHPLEVMHLLISEGGIDDHEILIAAVLHDVVEDTQVTGQDIREKFGKRVEKIVLELTDDKSLSKDERKKAQLDSAASLSREARFIRLSDKICNVYDILYAPPGNWGMDRRRDYLFWAEAVIEKIKGINEPLEKKFAELMKEGIRFLNA